MYLAQRFEKPKDQVTAADWERADSWKIPSLATTSLDAGVRPIDVQHARTTSVDIDNGVLHIPREDAPKYHENWVGSFQNRTVTKRTVFLRELRVALRDGQWVFSRACRRFISQGALAS